MDVLETVMEEIKNISWTKQYQNYIHLYQKGLKKEAKSVLKEFLQEFESQSNFNRRHFIDTAFKAAFLTEKYTTFLPSNLYHQFFIPAIRDWISEEPENPIPYRWSNDLNDNKKAIQIEPTDQIALEICAKRIIGKVSMNQHEISSGFPYHGTPEEDISLIEYFEMFIDNFHSVEKRNSIYKNLMGLKNCALLSRKSGNGD